MAQAGPRVLLIEAKSGETVASDAFGSLDKVAALLKAAGTPPKIGKMIVYGGHDRWTQRETTVLPWGEIDRFDWLALDRT